MLKLNPLLSAIQFLTILPVPHYQASTRDNALSLLYYPLVGLLLAFVLIIVAKVVALPLLVTSALVLTIWIAVTGGLHLDGLADSADAWLGGLGNKQRTLDIMKDPYCGPIAVIVLVLQSLLKFSLISVIISTHNWLALAAAPILARTTIPLLFLTMPYVRQNGLGSSLTQNLPATQIRYLSLVVTLLSLVLLPIGVIVSSLAVFLLLRFLMEQRLGGFTGDLAGATIEIMETFILLASLIF